MTLKLADRVQETTTTSGTGTLTLAGAVAGFQSFSAGIGNGNTCYYTINDLSANAWEVGIGTFTSPSSLSRDTVLSSSNSGSKINLSGSSAYVWVDYPAEKSVNLDASGNVTALGTVSSGTWQGTTVGVSYGGTGVTASSGANSVVLRDANQNITANNIFLGYTSTVTAAGTTTLTVASTQYQRFTGTTTQTVKLPDATTLQKGYLFTIDNDSTGDLTIVDNASSTLDTIVGGSVDHFILLDNSTTAGTWIAYGMLPSNYDFGATSANFGGATISNATWNGNAIPYNYGGTTLTTFGGANNAIYSTSATALAAGTLPAAAGGTGLTSPGTAGNVLTSNGSAWVSSAPSGSGAAISNDTSTSTFEYPLFAAATTGTPSTIYTSNTNLLYKPSTGELRSNEVAAGNGLVVNNATIASDYTAASGDNMFSVGPISVSSGVSVSVSSGQSWVVI